MALKIGRLKPDDVPFLQFFWRRHDGKDNSMVLGLGDGRRLRDAGPRAAGAFPVSLVEVCDGQDNDLDGAVDEGFPDTDGNRIADCIDPDDDNDLIVDWLDECPLLSTRNVIAGTAGNDTLAGTPGNDLIRGLGGNDTLIRASAFRAARFLRVAPKPIPTRRR